MCVCVSERDSGFEGYGGMKVREKREEDGEGRMGKSGKREMGMFVQEDHSHRLLH